jgi:DUF4097 and DUF4098 domain-containing protein YvlB
MRLRHVLGALPLLLTLWTGSAIGQTKTWEFSGVDRIDVDGVSGDILVQPADGDALVVELDADVEPEDNFRPSVEQRGSRVSIDEKWHGRNSHGHVEWTLYVPAQEAPPELTIDTASGGLTGRDVALRIELDTASGDIELSNVDLGEDSDFDTASGDYRIEDMTISGDCRFDTASGDLKLTNLVLEKGCKFSTASGDVEARGCRGYFDLSTASGDVDVRDCQIEGWGELSTASGDVSVSLDHLPAEGLEASSASGNVHLDVADYGDDFKLVLVKRKDRGRISCPFEYTSERTFFDNDHEYEEKIVDRGSGAPEIELRTASGRVTVRN